MISGLETNIVDCTYGLETMVLSNISSRRGVGEVILTAVYNRMGCGECIMASLGFLRLVRNSLKRFRREL